MANRKKLGYTIALVNFAHATAIAHSLPDQLLRINHFLRLPMPRFPLFSAALLLLASLASPVHATDRPFPESAKRGIMSPKNFPVVLINGKERLLSPAAQIRNTENMIEMPASLRGDNIIVNYTENQFGEIIRIWILTPEEIRQTPPGQGKPTPTPAGPMPPGH